jgi:anti-sigma-K factor RskA
MRQDHHPHGPLEPQDVEELLPWYVTGRVSREEARGIEAALKTMPDLADKLTQVQREREGVAQAAEAVEPAPPETLQRLLQQVETTRQWRVPRIERVGERGSWLKDALARSWVWQAAFAAACIAIVALGVRLYGPSIAPGDLGAATDINGVTVGTPLVVTFQPTAAAGQIGSLLTQLNATIVSGPTADGTYVVRIPGTQPGDVNTVVDALISRNDLVLTVQRGS